MIAVRSFSSVAGCRGSVADGRRHHVITYPVAAVWEGAFAFAHVVSLRNLPADSTLCLLVRHLLLFQLKNGHLITLPPSLLPRLKSHFHTLPCGVDLILGLNGFIWVSMHIPALEDDTEAATEGKAVGGGGFDGEGVYSGKNDVSPSPASLPRQGRHRLTGPLSIPIL